MKTELLGYSDYFNNIYCPDRQYDDGTMLEGNEAAIRDVTFVVTDKC